MAAMASAVPALISVAALVVMCSVAAVPVALMAAVRIVV
jgi:hypothetical protein